MPVSVYKTPREIILCRFYDTFLARETVSCTIYFFAIESMLFTRSLLLIWGLGKNGT